MPHRNELIDLTPSAPALDGFAEDVRAGLSATPKRLSCRFFYDVYGSKIFEEICALPEYYLTRAEQEILEVNAGKIAARCQSAITLLELGSGSARKTRVLIEALIEQQGFLQFVPIDISPTILEQSSRDLRDYYPNLEVTPVAAEYREGLGRAHQLVSGPKLILWLGSNVGNFGRGEAALFIESIRQFMSADDRLMVGIDLRKDKNVLEAAYDDVSGVTARFNLNILNRINRDLGGTFDSKTFRHEAIYNEEEGRVEMYLVSDTIQVVNIADLDCTVRFDQNERIHTENSYKYSYAEIEQLARSGGLRLQEQWFDELHQFSLNLLAKANPQTH